MSPDTNHANVIRPRVFARERLDTVAEPAPKPFVVFARGAAQSAHITRAEARDAAKALALEWVGAPVEVLQLTDTFRTATIVQEF